MTSSHDESAARSVFSEFIQNPIFAAFQFLTVFPVAPRRSFNPSELGRSVGYYPLVGLVLGAVLVSARMLFSIVFPAPVSDGLILVLWVGLTGALHLDGFLDACDGLFGGRNPESRLEIMRDERVGAFGLAGGVLLLLLKYSVLRLLPRTGFALLLAPTLARWGMSLAVMAFPYAREEGLGRSIKENVNWRQIAFGAILSIGVSWFTFQKEGIWLFFLVAVVVWLLSSWVIRRIPGLTGDIYGALCEISEFVVMLVLSSQRFGR